MPVPYEEARKYQKGFKWVWCEYFGLFGTGYVCEWCGRPYFTKKGYDKCHPQEREQRRRGLIHLAVPTRPGVAPDIQPGRSGMSHTGAGTSSPYPGGPNGPAGFVPGAEYGGHYMSGSPYPGGPNGPSGFVPGDGFVSYGPGGPPPGGEHHD